MHCRARENVWAEFFTFMSIFCWCLCAGFRCWGQNFPADTGAVSGARQYWERFSLSSPMDNEKLDLPQLFHTFHLTNFLLWAHKRPDGCASLPLRRRPAAMPLRPLQLPGCAICVGNCLKTAGTLLQHPCLLCRKNWKGTMLSKGKMENARSRPRAAYTSNSHNVFACLERQPVSHVQ